MESGVGDQRYGNRQIFATPKLKQFWRIASGPRVLCYFINHWDLLKS
ncbi:uncharacterized protein G2W53_016105 [Senna tora]|uniref:Uncharacterized protein n=1 Tax=Senna tora TaxID=362788 RepID=A0A834WX35_9FABA|nr:uncharacterized protein G2W53_016105 [Senna tora]